MKKQKTGHIKSEMIKQKWFTINAEGKVLGRLASNIAKQLIGKNSVEYMTSVDNKDFIIVYNVEKIVVTGKKQTQKKYYNHSRYPGGLKETTYKDLLAKNPEQVILHAVKGMLPKNKLGRNMLTKLKVVKGEIHKYSAQNAEVIEFTY